MVLARIRDRLRPAPGRGTEVVVVGSDAAVVAALRDAGVTVVERLGPVAPDGAGPRRAVVVLDPTAAPVTLPRGPLRVGVVAPGGTAPWLADRTLEDLDAVIAATDADADRLAAQAVTAPHVTAGRGAGRDLVAVLDDLAARPRLHVITSVSNLRLRHRWGDHHYAVALARAAARAGWLPRTWCQAELADVDHGPADLVVLLAGRLDLAPVAGTPTLAWVISHPERLDDLDVTDPAGLGGLVHVHVASPTVAADLARAGVPASTLLQATDASRFRPTPGGPAHELLFVANSRNVRRRILDDLLPTEHELAVYGYGWTPELLDPRHLVDDHLPNARLPAAYSAAGLVLNDHWDDMRARGLLANRLFDAAACGAAVVSDDVLGLHEVFGDTVTTYTDPADLRTRVAALLADAGRRRDLGDRARAVVLDGHTFAARFAALLASAPPSLRERARAATPRTPTPGVAARASEVRS